ncbi:unnamed protein product [Chironomus riparius]|uniref:Palmitoyltransferase n=1 Tax=Chironomus riparius TaxID=315576 RepID=A0A9N9S601_9DIPT|nr:unnamed protein product [Chironomus riparius]
MFQKTSCAASAGACAEPETEKDPIIVRVENDDKNLSKNIDCSEFDVIKAVQYGACERVSELIEAGLDVNQPDNDTVYLLHWAAINNRREIIKLLIEKGAIVNVVGGDLQSTPLHWAVRQGHLAATVLLMKNGADPNLLDAEGSGCIHLASQFGHTAVVAYLIAKNVYLDIYDSSGMTPLMWSAWKMISLDPVRLLLTLGANPNLQDLAHGNTALHWAILSRNHRAIHTLVIKGKANIDVKNKKGDSPLQLLQQHIGSRWITREVTDLIKHITQQRSKVSILMKITMNQDIKWWTLVCIPFILLFSIGLILSAEIFFIFKIVLIVIVCVVISIIKRIMLDDNLQSQLPLMFYWATMAFFYVSWAVYIAPVVPSLMSFLFGGLNFVLFICFIVLLLGDPGILKATLSERLKTIIYIAESDEKGKGFEPSSFCSACLIRRPIRSKHCSVCDRCVGKFDHHCPWIANDIGINNHRIFILFILLILFIMILNFYGGILFYQQNCNLAGEGIWNALLIINNCSLWVVWMMINACFHIFWVTILSVIQFYQIVFMGMTTNERVNRGRYKHFAELGGKSPFHLGLLNNLADFFQCNCFGLFSNKKRNWMIFNDNLESRIIGNGSLLRLNEGLEYV